MRNTLGFRFENAHCLGSEDEFSLELVQLVSLLLNVLVNSPMDADSGVSCICQAATLFVEDTPCLLPHQACLWGEVTSLKTVQNFLILLCLSRPSNLWSWSQQVADAAALIRGFANHRLWL